MLDKNRQAIITLACGVAAGAVFSASAGSGVLVMFVPAVPLAILGFSSSAAQSALASIVACLIIGALVDADDVPGFLLLTAFPAFHFVRKALLWRGEEHDRHWYPVLTILTELSGMAAVLFMLFMLSISYSEHAELKTIVAQSLNGQVDNTADPDVNRLMQQLVSEWSFLLFACASWACVLLFYFFMTLANTILKHYHADLRPSLAVSEEGLPTWLPFIVLICAFLAFVGHGNDQFAAQAILMIMLLPYFLCGVASFHRVSQAWPKRMLWLTLFYIGLGIPFSFPWLAVLLIARGLQLQTELMLKGKHESE